VSNKPSATWAENHALTIPNFNPIWDDYRKLITSLPDQIKNTLQENIIEALERGMSVAQLQKLLLACQALTEDQAKTIAWTELARADVAGNLTSYRISGIVSGKEWLNGSDACPICLENVRAGVIGLNDLFPSGDDAPPAHPRCRCDILPVTK